MVPPAMRGLRLRYELHVDGGFGVTPISTFFAGFNRDSIGIVIVDHGTRHEESNRRHEALVTKCSAQLRRGYPIVEPAHIETRGAFDRHCIRRVRRRRAQKRS